MRLELRLHGVQFLPVRLLDCLGVSLVAPTAVVGVPQLFLVAFVQLAELLRMRVRVSLACRTPLEFLLLVALARLLELSLVLLLEIL